MNDTQGTRTPDPELVAAYQAVNHHWAHAEQERWAILYNFLMASTILLLAWAAVFASMPSPLRKVVLVLLAAAGAAVSLLWVTIGCRVNTFIRAYGEVGEEVEDQLDLGSVGPFHAGERVRLAEKENPKVGTMFDRWGRKIPSSRFVVIVPLIFALVYAILICVSVVA